MIRPESESEQIERVPKYVTIFELLPKLAFSLFLGSISLFLLAVSVALIAGRDIAGRDQTGWQKSLEIGLERILAEKDKTESEWIEESKHPYEKGTGLLFILDIHSSEPNDLRRIVVDNISYRQVKELGTSISIVFFKWIPKSVASYDELNSELCNTPCVDTCTSPGCVCFQERCQ